VSDSQVLGDLLDQIPLDEQIDSVYRVGLMTQNNAVRLLQIGKHMQLFHPEKMQSLGKIQKFIRKREMNY
jgi:hypothetical protein